MRPWKEKILGPKKPFSKLRAKLRDPKQSFWVLELQDERRKLDIDNQKLDVEKEFTYLSQNKQDEIDKLNLDANSSNKK